MPLFCIHHSVDTQINNISDSWRISTTLLYFFCKNILITTSGINITVCISVYLSINRKRFRLLSIYWLLFLYFIIACHIKLCVHLYVYNSHTFQLHVMCTHVNKYKFLLYRNVRIYKYRKRHILYFYRWNYPAGNMLAKKVW